MGWLQNPRKSLGAFRHVGHHGPDLREMQGEDPARLQRAEASRKESVTSLRGVIS